MEYLGDFERMQHLVAKIKKRENISMVCLGGSITEGKYHVTPFPTVIGTAFCETYGYKLTVLDTAMLVPDSEAEIKEKLEPNGNLLVYNCGKSAVSSLWGLFQYSHIQNWQPDLAIIDYSINDHKVVKHRVSLESLIRTILYHSEYTQPIFLSLETVEGYNCYGHLKYLSDYYHIPLVNLGAVLAESIREKTHTWSEFYQDNLHPNENGQNMIGQCLFYYIRERIDFYLKMWEDKEITEIIINKEESKQPVFGNEYENMKLLCGKIELEDTTQTFQTSFRGKRFLIAYYHDLRTPSATISVEIDKKRQMLFESFDMGTWEKPHVEIEEVTDDVLHQMEIRLVHASTWTKVAVLAIAYIPVNANSSDGAAFNQVP